MTKIRKKIEAIRNNPLNVRFDDALKVAEYIGFTEKGGKSSHHTRARPGELVQLNFQKLPDGKAKPYQVRQLIQMLDKYEDENGGS